MAKQLFLMKGNVYDPIKHWKEIHKYTWSIKLDGMRVFWDGGVSRDRTDCPLAPGLKATGLWSNNAKIIYAPDWWLDKLPPRLLSDGELWAGPGKFQQVMSICRRKDFSGDWSKIRFMCFANPRPIDMFGFRKISGPNCNLSVSPVWWQAHYSPWWFEDGGFDPHRLSGLHNDLDCAGSVMNAVEQNDCATECFDIDNLLDSLLLQGHEGIMLKRKGTKWAPERNNNLLKIKPFLDSEATVIGYQTGRDTDKGGKLLGMIGALICDWNGKEIRLSGLTNHERELWNPNVDPDTDYYHSCPNMRHFAEGQAVTFKYRELTEDGMPKEARYWRQRLEE